ncbi:CDP-glycerol glycerophosphotransferase family protein [Bacillus shivajii]|uniref:CDP-glycerol glycerophosphotransferase family protein n=1 Tax=Bacillus shivajii TaxID=1983719 RepID=UPI001CF9EB77|nr:CDP-glycerol glycerophosphotransferase family protein [Bacillus shivajii]UCZ52718.1 CDP-glycerol glycerophosphotransferase family protein [Bacillus shivajii]
MKLNKISFKPTSLIQESCSLSEIAHDEAFLKLRFTLKNLPKYFKIENLKTNLFVEIRRMDNKDQYTRIPIDEISVENTLFRKNIEGTAYYNLASLNDSEEQLYTKWAFYVVLNTSLDQSKYYRAAISEDATFTCENDIFSKGPYLYQPYKTINGNFSIKKFHHSAINELEIDNNSSTELTESNEAVTLRGQLLPDLKISTEHLNSIGIILKKRGTDQLIKLTVERAPSNYWSRTVLLEDLPNQDGIIDFYFFLQKNNGQEIVYRMNIENQLNPINHFKKGFYRTDYNSFVCSSYTTKKGSLSLKLFPLYLTLTDIILNKISQETLEVNFHLQSPVALEKPCSITLENQDLPSQITYPVKIKKESKGVIRAALQIEKVDLIKSNTEYAVLFHEVSNEISIKSAISETNKLVGRELIKDEEAFHCYFNISEDGELTFHKKAMEFFRNIENVSIDQERFIIEGTTNLQKIKSIEKEQPLVKLLILNRVSGMSLEAPAEVLVNPDSSTKKDKYTFRAGFFLKDIITLIQKNKDILELYIEADFGTYKKKRKLGFKEFDYFKDGYLDTKTLTYNNKRILLYTTLTPKGNLKVETILQSPENLALIEEKERNIQFNNNEGEVWIIGERPDTAQDNGYYFFKYCRDHHPDLDVYYAILPGSKDEERLKDYGNILYIGSAKHAEMCMKATAFFSSHDIDYLLPIKGQHLKNYDNALRVFLQHGILGRKKVEYYKKFYKMPYNFICVSSEGEKQLLIEEFGYKEEEVFITGLSRFDTLTKDHVKEKHQILLIPTWRDWITTQNKFDESEYFMKYKSLLQNKQLHQLLEKYKMELVFYPHYRMQHFFKSKNIKTHPLITIHSTGETDLQSLLIESKLMITDYSSVSFDFNYLNKPVIFYHFDESRFFNKGILRPIEETFLGDILTEEHELINYLGDYASKSFDEKTTFSDQKHNIFKYQDQNNSERIFKEVLNTRNLTKSK